MLLHESIFSSFFIFISIHTPFWEVDSHCQLHARNYVYCMFNTNYRIKRNSSPLSKPLNIMWMWILNVVNIWMEFGEVFVQYCILFIIPYQNIFFCINTYLMRASFMYWMVLIHVENLFISFGLFCGRAFH